MALAALSSCATRAASRHNAANAKYPPRPTGCRVALYHADKPGVSTWEDIGVAEATCSIDDGEGVCLRKLRSEACRLGGDIIYDVPRHALRPEERALLLRGTVAHTLAPEPDKDATRDAEAPEQSGPVEPLPTSGG